MRFAECELGGEFAVSAVEGDGDGVSYLMAVHYVGDVLGVGDLLAVETNYEVSAEVDLQIAEVRDLIAPAQASSLGGSVGDDLLDEDSVVGGEAHLVGEIGTDGQ